MKDRSRWNRREFVQMAGSALGAMTLEAPLLNRANPTNRSATTRFVYVGFGGEGAKDEGIAVFNVRGGSWNLSGVVESATPSSLALDTSELFLYAVNEVNEYEGLPSGTVEAYAINAINGSLKLLNRQKLSLSATGPRHAAVSPDGRALVVAIHGGGAYNVLPLGEDGGLGRVSGILKETGAGPHDDQRSAHPQMVVFDRSGRVVSADLGTDRLNVLKLKSAQLAIAGRYAARAGDGPRQLAFHPNGRLLFVANELDASVACYAYDAGRGQIVGRSAHVTTAYGGSAGGVVIALDPAGEFLYTSHRRGCGGVSVWRISGNTGSLQRLQIVDEGRARLHELAVTPDGKSLLGLSREDGGVFGWGVGNGRIGPGVQFTSLEAPMSMVVKSL